MWFGGMGNCGRGFGLWNIEPDRLSHKRVEVGFMNRIIEAVNIAIGFAVGKEGSKKIVSTRYFRSMRSWRF